MERAVAITTLKHMRQDCERYLKSASNKRRRMRPSERAMTLAHYQMEIDALELAIAALNGEQYREDLHHKLTDKPKGR